MDFFSAQHGSQPSSATVGTSVDSFAQEIGRRFSLPAGQPLLTARLSPVATAPPVASTPATRLGNLSLRSKPPSPVSPPSTSIDRRVTTVTSATLPALLDSEGLLVLDIRPHGTFTQSRLRHALSLSVPSTLLKRPAFSLAKLTEMLPSVSARRRFAAWKSASRILVYDADSQTLPEGSNIGGLLRKFDNEAFSGDLLWLKGGFSALWRESRSLVDDGPPSPDTPEEEDDWPSAYLRPKGLPLSAFQQVSTTSASQRPPLRPVPIQAHHQVAPAPTFTRPVAANPFYDNIRQNRELAHGITQRIPLRLPPVVVARRDDLPFDWLKEIVDKADAEEGTEALAMQFYMIELREQRRLMGVMDHHSREARSPATVPFPYSITAAVEKGSKNRYTNIWPFEHARVRLNSASQDDYINASHVQPLGTDRRYIATQGPLPSTYTDFWTLCWEQNVRIIVMLTKEVEGATVKCGSYWTDTVYGPLRLQLTSTSSPPDHDSAPASGFDFGLPSLGPPVDPDKAIVRRSFLLSHTGHPDEPARKITQLQYLAWPDFDVPENPRGLLRLMREVDALREEVEDQGPTLLHCSAGIGRTGGFIIADAALDGIRREMRDRRTGKDGLLDPRRDVTFTASPTPMDVDSSDTGGSPRPNLRPISPMRDKPGRTSTGSPVHRARPYPIRQSRHDGGGTDTSGGDDPRRSLSPAPSTSSPPGSVLRPSVFAADADLRARAKPPRLSPFADAEPFSAATRFRARLDSNPAPSPPTSASASASNLFGQSVDKSTAPSSFPVSVESSRAPSPAKDAEPQTQALLTTFDYTDPRALHPSPAHPVPLSSFGEPVRKVLEDMREQRMSLCQSLRQYVFVHRAIVEGALQIVDELRAEAGVSAGEKRGASPTELLMEGAARVSKRPSVKRTARSEVGGGAAR